MTILDQTVDQFARSFDLALLGSKVCLTDLYQKIYEINKNMGSLCVPPYFAENAYSLLRDNSPRTRLVPVIGYPYGSDLIETKLDEIKKLSKVADGFDYVLCLGPIIEHDLAKTLDELCQLRDVAKDFVKGGQNNVKVIIEAPLIISENLPNGEECSNVLSRLVTLIEATDFIWVKLATGVCPWPIDYDIYQAIRTCKKTSEILVKASGGIKTLEQAIKCLDAGASCIGSSNANEIIEEFSKLNNV
jgi:deoxyribose-phosphate aldolase